MCRGLEGRSEGVDGSLVFLDGGKPVGRLSLSPEDPLARPPENKALLASVFLADRKGNRSTDLARRYDFEWYGY